LVPVFFVVVQRVLGRDREKVVEKETPLAPDEMVATRP
jgi:hypothetical protein